MLTDPSDSIVSNHILSRCRELGFALAGVCEAQPSDYQREYRAWIDAGEHGEMTYLARNVELRLDPRELLPGAKSIICVADRYWVGSSNIEPRKPDTPSPPAPLSGGEGRIARYARGDDYHKSMKSRLHVLCDELRTQFTEDTFRACVDTAPVLEREHAQRAGLGAIGKHTLLIERGVGSYLFLGEIITTRRIVPTKPAAPDPCEACTKCIDACPTQAITPWSIDATKCISYLTIEHRSDIDEQYHDTMHNWIFGCDICQEVCPHNQHTRSKRTVEINPTYEPQRDGFDLLEVLRWTEEDRREAFTRSAMKRANLDMMQRNVRIALRNVSRANAAI